MKSITIRKASKSPFLNATGEWTPPSSITGIVEPATLGQKMLADLVSSGKSKPSPIIKIPIVQQPIDSTTDIPLSQNQEDQNGLRYRKHGKNEMEKLYCDLPDFDSLYLNVIRAAKINPLLLETARRILKSRSSRDKRGLEENRLELLEKNLLNLIVYDLQATGLPVKSKAGSLEYPSLIQISLFHPLTGRHFTSYITPTKPISYEVSYLSGIYNSLDFKFTVHDPNDPSPENQREYLNLTLLDRPEITERANRLLEQDPTIDPEAALDLATQEFLDTLDDTETQLIILDDLDRNLVESPLGRRRAPFFSELIEPIFEFISQGESDGTTTLFISHNGAFWGEPLLKAELERHCLSSKLSDFLFLDSKDLFLNILLEEQISRDAFSRLLGEQGKETYNTANNVLSLWQSIE